MFTVPGAVAEGREVVEMSPAYRHSGRGRGDPAGRGRPGGTRGGGGRAVGDRVEVDQPCVLQHRDVVEHGLVGVRRELAHQGVAGAVADLGDQREDLAVRDAQQVHEVLWYCSPVASVKPAEPCLLLVVGLVRQGDVQLRGDLADPVVEVGVPDDQMVPGGPDRLGGRPLQRLLPGGQFPEPGEPHPHDEVPVGGRQRPHCVATVPAARFARGVPERSAYDHTG